MTYRTLVRLIGVVLLFLIFAFAGPIIYLQFFAEEQPLVEQVQVVESIEEMVEPAPSEPLISPSNEVDLMDQLSSFEEVDPLADVSGLEDDGDVLEALPVVDDHLDSVDFPSVSESVLETKEETDLLNNPIVLAPVNLPEHDIQVDSHSVVNQVRDRRHLRQDLQFVLAMSQSFKTIDSAYTSLERVIASEELQRQDVQIRRQLMEVELRMNVLRESNIPDVRDSLLDLIKSMSQVASIHTTDDAKGLTGSDVDLEDNGGDREGFSSYLNSLVEVERIEPKSPVLEAAYLNEQQISMYLQHIYMSLMALDQASFDLNVALLRRTLVKESESTQDLRSLHTLLMDLERIQLDLGQELLADTIESLRVIDETLNEVAD